MIARIFILPIRFYRYFISPMFPPSCRFTPTCSQYFLDAVQIHGVFKGSILGVRRIFRCAPWGGQGHDPVPLRIEINREDAEKNL